jgi:succinylglutamic semialdehyde dehydrogenase
MKLDQIFKGSFVANEFTKSKSGATWENRNPFDWTELHFEWFEDTELASQAIDEASRALFEWSNLSYEKRAQKISDLKNEFIKEEKKIAELIARETGKAIWESELEAKALSAKIDVSLNIMMPAMKQIEAIGFKEHSQYMKWKARGICVVLGPFNFPLHLANGHIIPALLAGNTVIFKGSEQSPACSSFYAELFHRAGFPKSVFQMLLGGAKTGQALIEDPRVQGVFFTGSYENGRRITQNLLETRGHLDTLAALELGGKNASIIHEDADFKKSVSETWMSVYATAGQRCSCSSRIFVHQKWLKDFERVFIEGAKKIKVGDPLRPETFMGPLIHQSAVEQFLNRLDTAKKEGFECKLESRRLKENSCLLSPSVYLSHKPEKDTFKSSLQEEFFGPNAIIIPYSDLHELIEWHERAPFGLVTSIFTQSRKTFDFIDSKIEVGLVNLNRASVGASSQLAFGGKKRSGNNWPAGIFSYFYCASPRSYLEDHESFDIRKFPSGLQSALGDIN